MRLLDVSEYVAAMHGGRLVPVSSGPTLIAATTKLVSPALPIARCKHQLWADGIKLPALQSAVNQAEATSMAATATAPSKAVCACCLTLQRPLDQGSGEPTSTCPALMAAT